MRQLYPASVVEHLVDHVFAQCVAAGLVTDYSYTQAVELAPVNANASLKKLGQKQATEAMAPTLHVAGEPLPDVLVLASHPRIIT
jgi:hypothetical protein